MNGRFPLVRSNVLWYEDEAARLRVVANANLPGGEVLRLVPALEVRLLERCDGTRAPAEIAGALGLAEEEVRAWLDGWETRAPGTFSFVDSPEDEVRRERAEHVARGMLLEWEAGTGDAPDARGYHRTGVTDAHRQFEIEETTVSHLFRRPHRALGGRTYGEAFCDRLLELGALAGAPRMLEIGGGTGLFGRALLDRLRARAPGVHARTEYTFLDLSPILSASQRETCAGHAARTRFVVADALADALAEERFDVLLANEMIADLPVGRASRTSLEAGRPGTEAERLVAHHGLEWGRARASFAVNVGAIRLVERLPSWLAPGGLAVLTEYGGPDELPWAVDLPGHREHSIHFGHLLRVADRLGLAGELEMLGDFLGFDGTCPTLAAESAKLLFRHLLPFLGREPLPPALAYDRAALDEALGRETTGRLGNLRFAPLDSAEARLSPFDFWALRLRR